MGKTYSQLIVGEKAHFEKTIAESDVYMFAGITGDFNWAHINEEKAKTTKFGGRIAHGMLVSSFISTTIGMELPGPGTIYLSQSVSFKAPVRIGDTIKAEVEVLEKLEKGRVRLKTICYNQRNEIVVEGEALVLAPKDI